MIEFGVNIYDKIICGHVKAPNLSFYNKQLVHLLIRHKKTKPYPKCSVFLDERFAVFIPVKILHIIMSIILLIIFTTTNAINYLNMIKICIIYV